MRAKLNVTFEEVFQTKENPSHYFAPGRINLIGEHTDYNGGYVLPAGISLGTYALVTKRNDKKIRFYSMNFEDTGIIECHVDHLAYNKDHSWANYPKGVLYYLHKKGYSFSGMDILYYGTIPNGSGLSSSASIEMVTSFLVNSLFQLSIDTIRMVELGKLVENKYIGVNSGIMDQFAIGFSKLNHAILLNTETLEYNYVPVELHDYVIVIIDTNKQRELSTSDYNVRRLECNAALHDLQKELNINHLCQLTPEDFEKNKHLIKKSQNAKRAKHVIYESARTLEAANLLKNGDLKRFGQLLNDSHHSLKNDYEVTGIELDTIVHAAQTFQSVLGARMTGAGFGGCAIAIVERKDLKEFKQHVNSEYSNIVGYDASFYDVNIGNGTRELKEVNNI